MRRLKKSPRCRRLFIVPSNEDRRRRAEILLKSHPDTAFFEEGVWWRDQDEYNQVLRRDEF
jgi:hypothetical protein